MLEHFGRSLELAFAVAAVLTFVIQSPNAICILGIGLLGAGALTVEQTLMVFYGAGIGSGGLLYLLSSGLAGRSRQIAMYMVLYDILTSVVLVPLLYVELHLGAPLAMALLERLPFATEINLAIFYVMTSLLALPLLLGSVDLCAALKRRWPSSLSDAIARPRFILDTGAGEDPLARVRQEYARERAELLGLLRPPCAKASVWRPFVRRHAAFLTTSGGSLTPCPCGGTPTRSRRATRCATSTGC